jgi:hypothetical protein
VFSGPDGSQRRVTATAIAHGIRQSTGHLAQPSPSSGQLALRRPDHGGCQPKVNHPVAGAPRMRRTTAPRGGHSQATVRTRPDPQLINHLGRHRVCRRSAVLAPPSHVSSASFDASGRPSMVASTPPLPDLFLCHLGRQAAQSPTARVSQSETR